MPEWMEHLSGAIAAPHKVLRPHLAAEVGSARFLGEIQTAARLRHSPILPLYNSEQADGLTSCESSDCSPSVGGGE